MARLNLLPWREERRKQQKKTFATAVLATVLASGAVLAYAHFHVQSMIDGQNRRNDFLRSEIATLDAKIKEIDELESTKAKLQARIDIISRLQESRPQAVHVFDELARTLPDGVYLTGLSQREAVISLTGVAQSNARVSAYMRNLEDSGWLDGAVLDVIQNRQAERNRVADFNLHVNTTAPGQQSQAIAEGSQP